VKDGPLKLLDLLNLLLRWLEKNVPNIPPNGGFSW